MGRESPLIVALSVSSVTASRLKSNKYRTFPVENISFISGERFEITVAIPLTPFGKHALSQNFDEYSFHLKVYYNGEHIYKRQRTSPSSDVRHPSLLYFDYVLMRKERAVSVMLRLPAPVPDDEGIYELQVFFNTYEIMRRLRTFNCSDYGRLLYSPEGLKLYHVLVGSTTVQLLNYGKKLTCCVGGVVISLSPIGN